MAARTPRNDLGHRLRVRRAELGVTQQAVFSSTGIQPSRLSLIENGWTSPTPEQLKKLAAVLRLPLAEIRDLQTGTAA